MQPRRVIALSIRRGLAEPGGLPDTLGEVTINLLMLLVHVP